MSQSEPSPEPASAHGGSSSQDQLVVDTRDLRAITAALGDMHIGVVGTPDDIAQIPRLQVALITMSDVDNVDQQDGAAAVRDRLTAEGPAAGHTTPPTALDVLMTLLRDRFQTKYGRPLRMGRNRDMQVVGGLPHWAAANLPEPVDKPIVLPPSPPEPGEGLGSEPALKVGVLDTAMYHHPALEGRYDSVDFVSDVEPRRTWEGHATFVVGRILQRAPDAGVLVRKVLEGEYGTATAWQLAERMASFLGTGVQVLNLSLGCFTVDDQPPFLLQRAAEVLMEEMVVVAAAGNHGTYLYPMPALSDSGVPQFRPKALNPFSPMWPAAIPGVVAVGAATVKAADDGFAMDPADFTPTNVPWIELWAPGVDVVSTYLGGKVTATTWAWESNGWGTQPTSTEHDWVFTSATARWSGTSMSAGDVTGEIAAVAQAEGISARDALKKIKERPGGPTGPFDVRPWI